MQELTDKDFDDTIKGKGPIIVDFWASWCGPCKALGPILEELSGEYEGKLRFAKLNTEEFQELTGRYGIMGIPCNIVFNKGEEVGRIIGSLPKDAMKQKIDEIIASL